MPDVLSHLEDLRYRLLRSSIAIGIGFGGCLTVSDRIYALLAAPVLRVLPEGSSLIFTNLSDPFFVQLKTSFVGGVLLVLPYICYQLWLFVNRSLLARTGRLIGFRTLLAATLLFYAGAIFCYFVVFPAAFSFFLSFESTELRPMLELKDYVSLFMTLLLAFGLAFETPVVIVVLGLLGLVNSTRLRRARRYFIVLSFVIAAILTPTPDPVNQCLMAFPMIILFEAGLRSLVHLEASNPALKTLQETEPYSVSLPIGRQRS
jgi:sec-independent protein translocase protein TatC